MNRHGRLMAKIGAVLALIVLAEILIDDGNGAVVGGFALAWITALLLTRRAIWKDRSARLTLISCAGLAVVLVDDPSLLGWVLFWTAVSLAALLPRHRFDDAQHLGKPAAKSLHDGSIAIRRSLDRYGVRARRGDADPVARDVQYDLRG